MSAQDFGKVGVIYGGLSAERPVSLMSGQGVLKALQTSGVDAHGFDPAQRSLAELSQEKFDRVFIALHGRYGEDGCLQGALELMKIPYTGSGVMASAVAMDKVMTKRVWLTHGLSTPAFYLMNQQSDLDEIFAKVGEKLIVKPAREGSSIGITKVFNKDYDALKKAYLAAASHDPEVLVEELIEGRELTCAVIGRGDEAHALPLIEIVAPEGNYDYQNKYFSDDTRYLCPAPVDDSLTKTIQQEVLASYQALGCEGWARADLMLRQTDNKPFLIEINTSPGMTGHSLVPMAARQAGLSYEQLCLKILASARLKSVV
ncbi:D-alanine--D-alanine ligase [Ampullimonas aquatilis]|uniref:D-alanine--D-alanine ligase n=1 Tax=Ampullimonas aquatilis TaxID=1341549 RepID=UPI003C72D89F